MAHASIPPEDLQFGELAVAQGLCRREQVDECLSVLARLVEAGVSPLPRLGELLARKGYLSAERLESTRRLGDTPATSFRGPGPAGLPAEAEPAAADPANVQGKYVKVSRLGAGGMGEVWKGWDRELGRWVALKFLKHDDPQETLRFQREAQTAAGLNHPNIAPVHEVGQWGGKPFLAMQFVRGRTLAVVPRNDVRLLARLVRDAALAVHHAHTQGVVHRDLKPHNIMVEESRVYVMDFGLAKSTAVGSSVSVSGAILGTPAYMAPEQARGDSAQVGPRSDVWSLGATLYDLLADRPPFQADDVYALLKKVVEDEPPPLRKRSATADADLETLVMKCLEKDPGRRYGSALELAEDLTRWLAGEAIHAHPPSAAYKLRKFLTRRKGVVTVAALGLAAVGILVPTLLRQRALTAEERETRFRSEKELKELGHLWSEIAVVREWVRQPFREPEEIRAALEKAVAGVSEFVRLHPGHPQALYIRARGLLYLGRIDAAERDLAEALRAEPGFAPARALAGHAKLERYRIADSVSDSRGTKANRQAIAPLITQAQADFAAAAPEALSIERWGLAPTRLDAVQAVLGRALMARFVDGKKEEALRMLREAHAESPSEEFARWLGALGPEEEEDRWMEETLRIAPHWQLGYVDRGTRRLTLRQYEKAAEDFTTALRIDPDLFVAANNRGVALMHLRRLDEALRDLDRARSIDPTSALAWSNAAGARLLRGDFSGALKDTEEALARAPDFPVALANRGGAKLELGDLDGAIADSDRAITLDAGLAIAFTNRAGARLQRKDYEGAFKDAEESIRLDPTTGISYANRAGARIFRGDSAGALIDATKAIELDPGAAKAYINRAGALIQLGRGAEALEDAKKASEIRPGEVLAWINRSSARLLLGELDAALEDVRRAVELAPANADAVACRGAAHLMRDEHREARRDFDRALELDPKHPLALANRGLLKHATNDPEGALADLTRAADLGARFPGLFGARAAIRCEKGEFAGALDDYGKAIELAPDLPESRAERGLLRHRLKDYKAAVPDLRKSLELAPADWPMRDQVRKALEEAEKAK